MQTNDLIAKLTDDLEPVPVIKPISRRFEAWFIYALVMVVGMVVFFGVSENWASKLNDSWFLIGTAIIFSLVLSSAWSALQLSVPGAAKKFHYRLPLFLLAGWVSFEVAHLLRILSKLDSPSLFLDRHFTCGALILGIGLFVSWPLYISIRRAVPLEPARCGALTGLSGAAFGALGIQFLCAYEAPTHALLWHLFPTLAVGALGIFLGRRFFQPKRKWGSPKTREHL